MNILDLLIAGIEVQLSHEEGFVEGAIIFRFRKGDLYYKHIMKRQEILELNLEAFSSTEFESIICKQVLEYFETVEPKKKSLQIGDWVICSKTHVIGRITRFYTPTACEEQIMVKTNDGRQYHAPTRLWKPYQFSTTATQIYTDELAFMNQNPNLGTATELLNAHGKYAAGFARNHGISIDEALQHPTVKAHSEYFNKVTELTQKVLKDIYPPNYLKGG